MARKPFPGAAPPFRKGHAPRDMSGAGKKAAPTPAAKRSARKSSTSKKKG